MTETKKSVAVPVVGAAILAAAIASGGVPWVLEQLQQVSGGGYTTTSEDREHRLVGQITTSGNATVVFIVDSAWRGRLLEQTTSVSRQYANDVTIQAGEPIKAVLLGEQSPSGSRQRIECLLTLDGAEVSHETVVVREETKTVKCGM